MRGETENKKTRKTIFGLARKINNTKAEGAPLPLQKIDKKYVWVKKDSGELENNIVSMLRKFHYDLVIAESEKEIWDSFKQKPSAFFITKMILPEMPTFDLLKRVKGTDPLIEVIIVTGCDAVESYLESITT